MALLAFEDTKKSPVGHLLEHSQRQKVASELNAAILTAQCREKGLFYPRFCAYKLILTPPPPPTHTHTHTPYISIFLDPKLPGLLKMLIWAQTQLDEKVKYPRINNLATAELVGPDS